jgi:hypothetical protein
MNITIVMSSSVWTVPFGPKGRNRTVSYISIIVIVFEVVFSVRAPLANEDMLLIVTYVIENVEVFETESEIRAFSTRHRRDLHRPAANLTVCQKRVDSAGLRLCNKPLQD